MQLTEWIPAPSNWENLKYHPLSEIVGFGVGIDVDGLAAHMSEHGYDDGEPIVIWRDMILDGRHKHAGAKKAKVTPTFVRFVGKSAEAYVAKKAFRQHLNTSQRAMIAATIAKATVGKPVGGKSDNRALMPNIQDAANALNVAARTVTNAKKVIEEGTPTLQAAVLDGTVTVTDAAKITAEPPTVQNKAVEDVKTGKAPTATKAVIDKKPKAGSPKFNDKKLIEHYGKLVREVDALGKATSKGRHHKRCMDLLGSFLEEVQSWKREAA